MKRLRSLRPTPSMLIACAALFIALAGTSVAAVSIVIPRNSIGSLQLKANSVNSAKVLNGSLRPGRLPLRDRSRPARAAPPVPPAPQAPPVPQAPLVPGAAGAAAPGFTAETLAQSSTSDATTTSTTYTNLNGGSLTATTPTGETDKLVVYFSGESTCYGGTTLQQCLLKITVDGTELSPAAGADAFFDNNDLGVGSPTPTDDTFRAKSSGDSAQHAIVRVSANLSAGAHVVQVQYSSRRPVAFNLDDWALVVQRIKVS